MSAVDRLAYLAFGSLSEAGLAGWDRHIADGPTQTILDALPALLREDSTDGEELRAKLGLRLMRRTAWNQGAGMQLLAGVWEPRP